MGVGGGGWGGDSNSLSNDRGISHCLMTVGYMGRNPGMPFDDVFMMESGVLVMAAVVDGHES